MISPQGLGSIVMLRRTAGNKMQVWFNWCSGSLLASLRLSLHCTVSSDYWHYSKFAADNQPQIPAKFLITLLEMSLGF